MRETEGNVFPVIRYRVREDVQMADAVRIFISYAHEDVALRERLRVHLSQLERDGLVKAWDDREIPAGSRWADEIDERLESADVILLLVSADYIGSEFCYGKEMARAMERHNSTDDHAMVIPVILRKCDWKTAPFGRFQALPTRRQARFGMENRGRLL